MGKFDESLKDGIHHKLAMLEGNWEGTAKVWFDPAKLEDESPAKASFRSILGGRFMMQEYEGTFKGNALTGIAIIGYSFPDEKFQVAWVDSFHTGTTIMFSQGNDPAKLVSVLGSYGGKDFPEPWGWSTEIEMPDNNTIVFKAYNIEPGAAPTKATETVFKRK